MQYFEEHHGIIDMVHVRVNVKNSVINRACFEERFEKFLDIQRPSFCSP